MRRLLKQYVSEFCGEKASYKELYHFFFVLFLAVLNMAGEFLMPIPSWSRIVYKAGTKIVYTRNEYKYEDEISTQCPITEDIELVVRAKQVKINYEL